MKHYNKKRKLSLKESAMIESYVDHLIKESYKRVLNENEILTLVAYTEGLFGKTFRFAAGLPYMTADPSTPNAPGVARTKAQGQAAKERAEKFGNKVDSAIYNTVLKPVGRGLKRFAKNNISDPVSQRWNAAKGYVGGKLADFGNAIVDPSTYSGMAKTAYNAVNDFVNRDTPNIGMWDGQPYVFDNRGKPLRPAVVQGNFQQPQAVAASESYIRKNGKRVKQKQIMTDFQEQMLVDYLKYQKKKTKRKK